MSIGTGTAIAGGGILSGLGSIFGSSQQSQAAIQAAQIQAAAAHEATQLQRDIFTQTTQNLSPWLQAGQTALAPLLQMVTSGQISSLPNVPQAQTNAQELFGPQSAAPSPFWGMSQFTPTMAQLSQTPGYQFTLQQGLQGTKNAYAAQGLGGSITGRQASPGGPLSSAITQYASGLASNTFNQQFQNWLQGQQFGLQNQQVGLQSQGVGQQQQQLGLESQQLQMGQNQQTYNMYGGISGSGQNAAANLGSLGLQAATGAGNFLTSGAAAQAGGIIGSANATAAGIGGATSGLSQAALGYALQNNGMFGNPTNGAGLALAQYYGSPYGGTGGL